jgi:hypothetical protein
MEDARFQVPSIPQSGVKGVTYNRAKRTWDVRLLISGEDPKYIGSHRNLGEAIRWQAEVSLVNSFAAVHDS